MDKETFAEYILSEEDWGTKMEIMYYLKRKTGIHYNNGAAYTITNNAVIYAEWVENN